MDYAKARPPSLAKPAAPLRRRGGGGGGGALRGALLALFSAALLAHCYAIAVHYALAQREVRRVLLAAVYVLAFLWSRRPAPAARAPVQRRQVAVGRISRWALRGLFLVGSTLSLVAPWYLVLARGTFATLQLTAPHMLVYAVQLLFETWSSASTAYVPLPMRLAVILAAITYRLKLLHQWIVDAPRLPVDADVLRYLGYANVVYWALILQLLLVLVAPRYFPGRTKSCARES